MLLLVTDTSGKNGILALARVTDNKDPEIIESVPLTGGAFSAQLVPQIAALLASHRFRKTEIDAFIVVSGPGSFTGLRVGLAAIKALAEILHKPIVPVSLLEANAFAANQEGKILAILDAGRGEVYAGEYEVASGKTHVLSERLLSKSDLLTIANGSVVVTSDPALADSSRTAARQICTLEAVTASMIARLGWRKLQAGATVSPEQLEANYIRRTDAEIFAKPLP